MIYYTECDTCRGRGYKTVCRKCDADIDYCLCGIDYSRSLDLQCLDCDGDGMVKTEEETAHGYREEKDYSSEEE